MYGIFWHIVCFQSCIFSSRFFSTCFQAPNRRCFHHVISRSLYFYAVDHNVNGMDHIPVSRTAIEVGELEPANWTRNSLVTELLKLEVNDTRAPWNLLMNSGFVQIPRKGKTYKPTSQTSVITTCISSMLIYEFNILLLLFVVLVVPFCFVVVFGGVFYYFCLFYILHMLCCGNWVTGTGNFHRLLLQNRHCGKITIVNQHCPPHAECGYWINSGGTEILEIFNLN